MRKIKLFLIPIFLLACQALTPTGEAPRPDFATPSPVGVASKTPSVIPSPTETATPAPTATLILPTISPPQEISAEGIFVRAHPEDALYVGDQVSFEVVFNRQPQDDENEVIVTMADGNQIGTAGISEFGIAHRWQATLRWVWDTTSLEPGDYAVTFTVFPRGLAWTETYTLLPTNPDVTGGTWLTTESDCCVYYFASGTAASRDIEILMEMADEEADLASERTGGGEFEEPIIVVFMSRVLGHGGFATGDIYISYLDRNYAGNAFTQVLHHEMVHILDGRLGGALRPVFYVEGFATYLSGGHFKPEPLMERAAEVIDLGWYVPLAPLADDFYPSQHEISYLEAAALIEFMVETWGWDTFNNFYRSIEKQPSNFDSEAINQALTVHYGITFDQLEAQFLEKLNTLPDNPAFEDDVRLTVMFFDTVRRYQQALDPSAYFMTAWLLGIDELRERGIVADYVRHPSAPENLALETLLVQADADLRVGDFTAVERALEAVNAVLDAYNADDPNAFYAHSLAADYFALVQSVLEAGHTPEKIWLEEKTAKVWVRGEGAVLVEMVFVRGNVGWQAE